MRKRALSLLLAMALVLGLSVGASAASAAPTDLNRYLLSHTSRSGETRSLPIDRTEVNEHPVIGYYTYTFQDGEAAGRSFKLYVGQHAALRAYITVIALPDGIADPYAFLQEQGWLEQADTYGELLFVLEPGQGGNTKMTVEEFYQGAVDAEILIYDNTSDVSVSTVADILANGDYLADMKAIQEGNVWGIQKNYWQSADDVATMIEDIATIIYHPEDADQLHYFYKLPAE